MKEINYIHDVTGLAVYARVQNSAGLYWTGAGNNFAADEEEAAAGVAVVETPAGSFEYQGDFPTEITTPDDYLVTLFVRAGGADAFIDAPLANGIVQWDGAAEYDIRNSAAAIVAAAVSAASADGKLDDVSEDLGDVGIVAAAARDAAQSAAAAVALSEPDDADDAHASLGKAMMWLLRRFIGLTRLTKTAEGTGELTVRKQDGAVITTQTVGDDGTTETQGEAE